jgi:hypothetical protein
MSFGPNKSAPHNTTKLSSKTVNEWVALVAGDIKRNKRYPEHPGDVSVHMKLALPDLLRMLEKWGDNIGVDEVGLRNGIMNLVFWDPNPNLLEKTKRIFPINIPSDIVGGISPAKVAYLRKLLGTTMMPDRDFFAGHSLGGPY